MWIQIKLIYFITHFYESSHFLDGKGDFKYEKQNLQAGLRFDIILYFPYLTIMESIIHSRSTTPTLKKVKSTLEMKGNSLVSLARYMAIVITTGNEI